MNTRVEKVDGSGTHTYKRAAAHQTAPVLNDGFANYLPGVSEKRSGTSTFLHSGIKNGLLQTNSSQSNTATNRYDAFGNMLATTGTWKGPFAYGDKFGYQTDEADMELLGDRYYDPTLGRFLSRDLARDGRNWYAYCGNNPVSYADRTGRALLAVIAGAALIGLTVYDVITSAQEIAEDPTDPWPYVFGVLNFADPTPGNLGTRGARWLGRVSGFIGRTCFVAGTLILMADGTTKPIEKVAVGDKVLTRSQVADEKGSIGVGTVSNTFVGRATETLLLKLDNGTTIETTAEHPFYVEGVGFVEAGDLTLVDRLAQDDGESSAILAITRDQRAETVFNFSVAGTHTYFVVAGDDSIWVHNKWHGTGSTVKKSVSGGGLKPGSAGDPGEGLPFPRKMVKEMKEDHVKNNTPCTYCGTLEGPWHLDHIIARSKGGNNTIHNAQCICWKCNLSKGNRDAPKGWPPRLP